MPVGIDNLKKIFIPLVKMVSSVVNAMREDSPGGKKVNWTELIAMAPNSIQILLALALLGQIWKELKDLDTAEIEELSTIFAETFDIADDDIEKAIEELIDIGVSYGPPTENLIEWFKKYVSK